MKPQAELQDALANSAGRSEVPVRILSSALHSFAERGYHQTTTRDISVGAGLSPAALYVHFTSKEVVLFELTKLGHEQVMGVVQKAATAPGTATARMFELARDFTTWHAENHQLARVIYKEWGALSQGHQQEIVGLRSHIQGLAAELIRQGQETGEFHVPDVRAAAIAALSLGIDVSRWFQPNGPYRPAGLGAIYAELTINLLGGSSASGQR